ncbi:helix-turn-helix transcriptional regulator [Streptacidiphilus sp. MAP5-3]|uniref:helix-turn-helix transcriptional regulator n=1 Tax=unclassified Streptacidiphilus TaxID=2643834 RepID=UPI0035134782
MPQLDPWLQHHRTRIGDRVHRLRIRRNLTQEQLGEAVGLDRQTISRLENGHRATTSDEVHLIARHLGVAPAWIFSDDDLPADEVLTRD